MSQDIFKKASFWGQILWLGLIVLIAIFSWEPKPRLEIPQQGDLFVEDLDKRPLFLTEEERGEAEHWLALNLFHETRGEKSLEAKIVPVWVAIHRTKSHRFPNNPVSVIQEGGEYSGECQFSWYCDGRSDKPSKEEQKSWEEALLLTKGVLGGKYPDPTKGGIFYYNPKKASPCWGKAEDFFIGNFGNHKVYENIPWNEMKRLCRPVQSTQLAQAEP